MANIQRFTSKCVEQDKAFFVRCVFRELPGGVRKQRGNRDIPCKQIV